jgi:FAD/FMN-containing dehydrogenase
VTGPRWSALAAAIDGEVDLRGSPEHARRARAFNARFDHLEPDAIVRCATPDDVAETVRFVARHGLARAIRSGGHSFAGHSSTTGTLVDVAPLHHVSVSADRVRAGGGVRLGELSRHLDTNGLAIAAGTCPEVGLAGLALGGGLGVLGRTHGVTSDQLLSAQVVLADASSNATPIGTPTCSGRCGAPVPGTSAWSPSSSSQPSPHRRPRAFTCRGRRHVRLRSSTPDSTGRRTDPTSWPPA